MSQRKSCQYPNNSESENGFTGLDNNASLGNSWLSATEFRAVGIEDISVCSGELKNIIPSSPQLVMNSDGGTSNPLAIVDLIDSSLAIESNLNSNRLNGENDTSAELLDNNETLSVVEISTTSDITGTNNHDIKGEVEDQEEVSVKNYEFITTIFDTDDSSDSDDDTSKTDDGDDSNDDEHNFNTSNLTPITSNSSITLFTPSDDNHNDNNDSIDYNSFNDNQDEVSSNESPLPSEYDQNSTFIPTSIEEENDMNEILNLSENPVVIRYVHEGLMRGNTVSNILDDVLAQYKENTQNIEPDFRGAGDFVYEINPLFLLNDIEDSDSE
ncbi:probable cyclin-dependent serine/threonine-protein kinase DDB_G0292550 isoform X2 [Teleopsis dalmanni]|uniref:probable cyclin-dependent serine/threonine-protein kinase DDB_G0292550 isoform X2 n=1 Tax=Teleopsis dalmanni TaxID=139649 RepID=UPI0018CD5B37|nr:probable cyclin-dependent serine/threonine-protein kinase DDB_G0292550 isoform X2 [Teleopsis dalmanni]